MCNDRFTMSIDLVILLIAMRYIKSAVGHCILQILCIFVPVSVISKHICICWNESGWSFSADLTLDNKRHLFAIDLFWHVLCDSTTLHESLLQVAVWVSIIVASFYAFTARVWANSLVTEWHLEAFTCGMLWCAVVVFCFLTDTCWIQSTEWPAGSWWCCHLFSAMVQSLFK